MTNRKTVLITGAAGNLGRKLGQHLEGKYHVKRIDVAETEDGLQADLGQWDESWVEMFAGVDTAVHLAADPRPDRSWDELIAPNMDATIHVINAALKHHVKRIVFASSNHVMGGYREISQPERLTTALPPLPGTVMSHWESMKSTPYAAAKLMGERLGKCYADIYDISVICVRIGTIRRGENKPAAMFERYADSWWREMWLSNRDYCQLMTRCIEAEPSVKFAVVNGMSNNAGMRWDIQHTKEVLGYEPEDGL